VPGRAGGRGDIGRWRVERQQGPAADLHTTSAARVSASPDALGGAVDMAGGPQVRILEVEATALILGSSQPEADVDGEAAAAAGVEVVRRRSGGGAVLVEPGTVVWVDLIVPVGDPLWDADIRAAAYGIGDAWSAALEHAGLGPVQVWRGGMRPSPWSARVCFAGMGPGEVSIDGRKVVGISQRRTRLATLFQTAALLRWDPAALLALLRLEGAERARGATDLLPVAAGVGPGRAGAIVEGLLAALP
jgi:lipoate-protein ligase A